MSRRAQRQALGLVAFLAIVAPSVPASAGLMAITQASVTPTPFYAAPGGTGFTNVNFQTNYLISLFDPNLGTLSEIDFKVQNTAISASVIVDNNSPFMVPFISGSGVSSNATTRVLYVNAQFQQVQVFFNQVQAQLSNPQPFGSFGPDSDGGISDFTGDDADTFTGTIPADFFIQQITAPSVLADFTGAGLRLVSLNLDELSVASFVGLHGTEATYGPGSGALTVDYIYTPAGRTVEASEPLPPLAIGLAALAAWRGRRRYSSSSASQ